MCVYNDDKRGRHCKSEKRKGEHNENTVAAHGILKKTLKKILKILRSCTKI